MEEARVRVKRVAKDEKREPASSAFNRISTGTSARTRRTVLFLMGLWCGGLLLVSLAAPTSFRAVDTTLQSMPQNLAQMFEQAGRDAVRELLRLQAAETNRTLFAWWGWIQFLLGLAVFMLLLFLSNTGKIVVGIAGLACGLTALMNFIVIPRMSETVANEQFKLLHAGFSAFQVATLVLIAVLLVLLFRRTPMRSGEASPGSEPGAEA